MIALRKARSKGVTHESSLTTGLHGCGTDARGRMDQAIYVGNDDEVSDRAVSFDGVHCEDVLGPERVHDHSARMFSPRGKGV